MSACLTFTIVPVTPFQQNCSVVKCEQTGKGCIIDPGGDLDRILGAADKLGAKIEKILVTHGHLDHAGATRELADQLGVPIEGPGREDAFWIDAMAEQGLAFGLGGGQPFTPDRWLEQGDEVCVGELRFQVIHCPGHTPGHVVFFHPGERLAFVGDVLFQGSIGRTDFPRGDYQTLIRSIQERLFPLGDDVRFVPGHGPMSTFGEERRTNPFVGKG